MLEVRYEGGRRWVGSDPAPAPTDSPTEAADMQAAAAAVLFLLAGETINPETIYCFPALKPFPSRLYQPAVGLIWSPARFPVDIWVIAPARISLQISLEDLCCSHTLGRTAVT